MTNEEKFKLLYLGLVSCLMIFTANYSIIANSVLVILQ